MSLSLAGSAPDQGPQTQYAVLIVSASALLAPIYRLYAWEQARQTPRGARRAGPCVIPASTYWAPATRVRPSQTP